jgi:hypothetical protein
MIIESPNIKSRIDNLVSNIEYIKTIRKEIVFDANSLRLDLQLLENDLIGGVELLYKEIQGLEDFKCISNVNCRDIETQHYYRAVSYLRDDFALISKSIDRMSDEIDVISTRSLK